MTLFLSAPSLAKVYLKDVGIIGLSSHDMFAWNHKTKINSENGRLDLSTIFDYDNGSRWKKGGDPKNGENAPVWSITKRLVDYHRKQLKLNGNNFELARKATVIEFHKMIKESYTRVSGMKFPETTLNRNVNNIEQAALRAFHDILPGRANLYRKAFPLKSFNLTNFLFSKLYLNQRELDQEIPYFNGDYDLEYQNIKIPFTKVRLDLKEIDRKFIEEFSPYTQKEMLEELKLVGEGEININEVTFIHHIEELYRKGFCSKDNKWINTKLPCLD
jgi:hypothetical protein